MRPALHRAALRRLAIRVAVVAACALAAASVLVPSTWLPVGEPGSVRIFVFALAAFVAFAAPALAFWRRPRPRVTAPRPMLSRA